MPRTLLEHLQAQRAEWTEEAFQLQARIEERGDGATAEERARVEAMLQRSRDLKAQIEAEEGLRDLGVCAAEESQEVTGRIFGQCGENEKARLHP